MIRQERAQPAHRSQLQRKPEPIVIAAALLDQLQIGVIQKDDPIQILPRQITVEAAIRSRLRIRQELDRHSPTVAGPALAALFVPMFPTGRRRR